MQTVLADRGAVTFEESVLESTGSEGLASDTGGFSVRNTNDLGGGAERVADRVARLLPARLQRPRGQAGPGLAQASGDHEAARARGARPQGLHARPRAAPAVKPPKKGAPRGPDVAVLRAVDSPQDAWGVPMRARAYLLEPGAKGQTRVLVMAEFDTTRLLGPGGARGGWR